MSLEPAHVKEQPWECKASVECQRVKVEREEETDGQRERGVHIKEEPEWPGGVTSSVKEESGLLDLYAGHKVEEDLVRGPEWPQPPDSAFAQPKCAIKVEPAEETNNAVCLKQSAGHDLACHGQGSGNPEPNNQMKRSTASPPFDEQLKVYSMDRPSSHQFPSNSSLKIEPHSCEVCMKQFAQSSDLIVHRRTHTAEKPYSCDMCAKEFSKKCHLIEHKRTHTGEKPYSCDVCMKQFARSYALVLHIRTHTEEKPYSCDLCIKQFAQSSDLIVHRRTHTGEKPYSCDVCSKKFSNTSHLIVHKRTHTGEKQYSCDVCMKHYTQRTSLLVHRRTHTGEKPYSCDVCVKKFTRKSYLIKHQRTHTGEKPYSCDVCMKQLKSKMSLNAHKQMHTRETSNEKKKSF